MRFIIGRAGQRATCQKAQVGWPLAGKALAGLYCPFGRCNISEKLTKCYTARIGPTRSP